MSAQEEWRRIPGYGHYEASSLGQIRRGEAGHAQPAHRVLKPKVDRHGYLAVAPFVEGRFKHAQVHRLVCLAFHGEPPSKEHEAGHRDGVRPNCRADNLRWVTHAEQIADRDAHGRYWHVLGEDHPMHVLTEDLVRDFRARAARGKPIKHIAREAGFAYLTIYDAVKRNTWKHVE